MNSKDTIPQSYKVVLSLEIDPDTYNELKARGYSDSQIMHDVYKGLHIELPAPCSDYAKINIEPIYGCVIGQALRHRIEKITNGSAL